MTNTNTIIFFDHININDIHKVGGKNASLGEMYNQLNPLGINIPNGFAVTAGAYRRFLSENKIEDKLNHLLHSLDTEEFSNLIEVGNSARSLIMEASMTEEVINGLGAAYRLLSKTCGIENLDVAVRSSATAEDLPSASFAGRMESFLNVKGEHQLLIALHRCYASLYTDRAIKYRHDMRFTKMDIAISVGIQQMVRSDKSSSGVAFTIDPDSGFENTVVINSAWGLGENVVQGRVTPDEWLVFKPTLFSQTYNPIIKSRLGRKEYTMVYAEATDKTNAESAITNIETTKKKSNQFSLSNAEVVQLAQWCYKIETHYKKAMDIEWAKDGLNNQIYIVQARPETVHGKENKCIHEIFTLKERGLVLVTGIALGNKITSGKARILNDPSEGNQLKEGDILVTDITNPDWDPVLKKAAAIITNKGGRTSHAAIVARELGTVAVVGCGNATEKIKTGQELTVSCAEGKEGYVYDTILKWEIEEQDFSHLKLPKTSPMFILADPNRAFDLCHYPNRGVGLMRLEFAISNHIQIHPLALCHPEKVTDKKTKNEINKITKLYDSGSEYFVNSLAEAITQVAAAFYPNEVIVRMSDFKSNEYANLLGGKYFEPDEENPMLGLRGASRYYSDFYRKGFALECKSIKKVREEMGMTNVKLMIPFCRTVEEGKKIIEELTVNGLRQKKKGLEVYVMIEIPSNALMADEFAKLFDGFSIGSNDLTQLTLGVDRDSALINYLFNEENPAVKTLIKATIKAAKRNNIKVGLCGQAPSDIPAFATFLVQEGIDSISFNPDAIIKGIENIVEAESH